ncbi:MAG: response regulator [Chitinivibrionales bacterium]|nr:response regulator [Chitinivibrionales bacterium]
MTAIMVVEDEEKISTVLCMKLKTKGYEVIAFFNGADAWKGLQKQKPDLVLLDVMMPRMTGFQLLEHMKKNDILKTVPVIFLTSVSQEEDVVRGLEMGANDYVVKPFSFAELHARIKKWI